MKSHPSLLSFNRQLSDAINLFHIPIRLLFLNNNRLFQAFIFIHALMIILIQFFRGAMRVVPDTWSGLIKVFRFLELVFGVQVVLFGQHGVEHVKLVGGVALREELFLGCFGWFHRMLEGCYYLLANGRLLNLLKGYLFICYPFTFCKKIYYA